MTNKELNELKAIAEKARAKADKAYADYKAYKTAKLEQLIAEGRATEKNTMNWEQSQLLIENPYNMELTEEEKAEEFKMWKLNDEATKRANEAEKAYSKAKREEAKQRKINKDLANGITPKMRKAMTMQKKYEEEINELQKQINELNRKKEYWERMAKGE